MFIRTLLILQEENDEELFASYIQTLSENNVKLRELMLNLQEKGIILKSYKVPEEGCEFDPYSILFNKNFLKNLYKCSFEMGKELFEVYPQFGNINNTCVPLRSIAKKFDSLEDAYFRYGKCIGWSPERHKVIKELVKWAKDNNIINMSLGSFIVNNAWLDLEAMKNGDNGFNVNYNSVKLI